MISFLIIFMAFPISFEFSIRLRKFIFHVNDLIFWAFSFLLPPLQTILILPLIYELPSPPYIPFHLVLFISHDFLLLFYSTYV